MHNTVRRVCFLVLCGVLYYGIVPCGCKDVTASEKVPPPETLPFLWKISSLSNGDDAQTSDAYLFGTIHVADKSVTTFHPIAEQAWNDASAAYFEIDCQKNADAQTKAISLPAGANLADTVPAELLQRLDQRLRKISPLISRSMLPNAKIAVWPLLLGDLDAQVRQLGQLPMDLKLFRKLEWRERWSAVWKNRLRS